MDQVLYAIFFVWWMHGVCVADRWPLRILCFLMPPLAWCNSIAKLTLEPSHE